jgi:N-formylglutamate deformylase
MTQHNYMDEESFAWNEASAAVLREAIGPLLRACLA